MDELVVIKIGGNIIDDPERLSSFLKEFAAITAKKILVHGGGKLATKMAAQLNIPQQLIEGRRVTDAETLKVVTMVYAGYINKNIVATLQSNGCNAIGLTGADGNLVLAHKRNHPSIDFGFVGDIDSVNAALIQLLMENDLALVMAPLTHDNNGQLLNTNADTIAQEVAKSLAAKYSVSLIFSFEKSGVLLNAEDDETVIRHLGKEQYTDLKGRGAIFAGMIPKLDNAFAAIENGVNRVIIGKAEQLHQLINGESGTTIRN